MIHIDAVWLAMQAIDTPTRLDCLLASVDEGFGVARPLWFLRAGVEPIRNPATGAPDPFSDSGSSTETTHVTCPPTLVHRV